MDTRTILTSPPVLSCDVCARRLLRGEHHEVFLHGGQRRIVCELCFPRAVHAGWLRERELERLAPSEPLARPTGGILQRLRRAGQRRAQAPPRAAAPPQEPAAVREPTFVAEPEAPEAPRMALGGPGLIEAGAEVFNQSGFPRRVRGLARSLGEPRVSIRLAEHLDTAVRIVIAWELCWYRYEIDLAQAQPSPVALEQGNELSQLAREEREWNALLDEEGLIAVAAAAR